MFNLKRFSKSFLAVLCCASLVFGSILPQTLQVEAAEALPTDFTVITPKSFGINDGTYTDVYDQTSTITSMDQVMLNADVTFVAGSGLTYGMRNTWNGIRFCADPSTGKMQFVVTELDTGVKFEGYEDSASLIGGCYIELEPTIAFAGEKDFMDPFNLKITTEAVNRDNDEQEDDLKLGLWFDDKLYNDTYFYAIDGFVCMGAQMRLANLEIKTPVQKSEEVLPTDFKVLDPGSFGFENKVYSAQTWSTLTPVTSMDKVMLDVDGKWALNSTVGYANVNTWYSLRFTVDGNGFHLINEIAANAPNDANYFVMDNITFDSQKAIGKDTFLDQEFNLKVTSRAVDSDNDQTADDLELGVWFNNKLYENTYIYVVDGIGKLGTGLYVTSFEVKNATVPQKEEVLPTDFKVLDPGSFGFENKMYSAQTWSTLTPVTSMDKVMLDVDGKWGLYSTVGYANVNQWYSLRFTVDGNGFHLINEIAANAPNDANYFVMDNITFDSQKAIGKDTFLDQEFNLKVTSRAVDSDNDQTADDLELGVWFNNKLYENTYIYVVDGIGKLGTGLYVTALEVKNATVPEKEEVLPTDFTVVTPGSFGFEKGTYATQTWNTKTPLKTMDKVMLDADLQLPVYGTLGWANINTWFSLRFTVDGNGFHLINEIAANAPDDANYFVMDNIIFDSHKAIAKDTFTEQAFNLKVTTEAVDSDGDTVADDLKLGVWFNDKLYENTYIYVEEGLARLGTDMYLSGGAYVENGMEDSGEVLTPPTLPEITFSDFNIADGAYSYKNNDLAAVGSWKSGFANKTFVGTVNFSNKMSSSIQFAGKESAWEGVRLTTLADGSLYFVESYERFKPIALDETIAQVKLVGKDVEVKLSFEVTDVDGDNVEDDVRFWLYFGGKLYNNKPIIEVVDYAQYLGNFLGIYSNCEASSVNIQSKDLNRPKLEVDFTIMGFTNDWATTLGLTGKASMEQDVAVTPAPNTADDSFMGWGLVFSSVALFIVAFLCCEKRQTKGRIAK